MYSLSLNLDLQSTDGDTEVNAATTCEEPNSAQMSNDLYTWKVSMETDRDNEEQDKTWVCRGWPSPVITSDIDRGGW